MKIKNNLTGELVEISEEERKKLIEQGLLPKEPEASQSQGQDQGMSQEQAMMALLSGQGGPEPATIDPNSSDYISLEPPVASKKEVGPDFSREATDKNLLEKLGNFFARNITSTGQLAARGAGAKQQLPETQAQITELGQQSRDLIAQAQATDDPAEKQRLLEESRKISEQIDLLGAGAERTAETMIDRGNVSEKDLDRSNLEFATRRGAATGLEGGAILAPYAMAGPTAALPMIQQRAIEGLVTGGLAGAAEAATQAETPGEAAGKVALGAGTSAVANVVIGGVMDWGKEKLSSTSQWAKDAVKNLYKKDPNIDGDEAVGAIQSKMAELDQMLKRGQVSQTLSPRHSVIEKGIITEGDKLGVNETIDFIANLDMPPDPKLLFSESIDQKKNFSKTIEKFMKEGAGNLPKIDMEKITSEALDDEIYRAIRLEDESSFNALVTLREKMGNKGQISFKEAYQLAKDFGQEANSVYRLDKAPSEVKTITTRGYTLLNNKARANLSKAAEEAGHPEWSELMNNYHQWSNIEEITKSVLADRQGKIGSIKNAIFSRLLPQMLVNDKLKWAAVGGVGGLTYGAVNPDESMMGGVVKGAAAGLVLPGVAKLGTTIAPIAAQQSKKALEFLAPQTGRSMLQHYLAEEE